MIFIKFYVLKYYFKKIYYLHHCIKIVFKKHDKHQMYINVKRKNRYKVVAIINCPIQQPW